MHPAVTSSALAALTLLVAAAPATAAPIARSYDATLTGTQHSEWTFEETGTCTGDDFVEHPFNGSGSGSSILSFRTPRATTVVASQVARTKRWSFNFQTYPGLAREKAKAPVVEGSRAGHHTQTCPNSESQTRSAPTDGCGERTYRLAVKASLNLPHGKPGQLELSATEAGDATGARWADDCPYFVGLNPTQAHDNDDQPFHIPGGGLLTVRKNVGTDALRRGKTLTITGKRTMPYDQTENTGDTTRRVRGETVVRWKLVLTPKRARR